jgi:hypothetical protein
MCSLWGQIRISKCNLQESRSQWSCGLRRGSTAARLLGFWVRIPPGAWMSVLSVVCCQVEVYATRWSLVQRSHTDCDASLCVIFKPQEWRGHGQRWTAAPKGREGGGRPSIFKSYGYNPEVTKFIPSVKIGQMQGITNKVQCSATPLLSF